MPELRLCADENISAVTVKVLEKRGCDVFWVLRDARGLDDTSILAQCVDQQRVVLTFDKDFGELIFNKGHRGSCGVILLRLPLMQPEPLARFISDALFQRDDWHGRFSVVESTRIRMRNLPK